MWKETRSCLSKRFLSMHITLLIWHYYSLIVQAAINILTHQSESTWHKMQSQETCQKRWYNGKRHWRVNFLKNGFHPHFRFRLLHGERRRGLRSVFVFAQLSSLWLVLQRWSLYHCESMQAWSIYYVFSGTYISLVFQNHYANFRVTKFISRDSGGSKGRGLGWHIFAS